MAQIVYSRNGLANLERLYRFLADKNPDAASRAVRTIRDKIKVLSRHPRLGRVDSEQSDCRELLIPSGNSGYVARYRLDGGIVVILAIRHAREAGYDVEM
ncbi:MAG: type II toxin-antitoxin system RelE/ParE family toxin [Reyranella sp.]|uniref:type II toxin-antitoxin system RelE/ParE family toxin n=1 Tax=Reyranella sp. TaxID=1929291 RepID=UPI001ACCD38E|nr:type II toxin-antitoxin system RelE/ParE family toxin [Reyranella sp.]MBN9087710.1 type II toxin-antitoxin system RelE/ParE family toxin [Reyranella sp.]